MQDLFKRIEQTYHCTLGVYAVSLGQSPKRCLKFRANQVFPAASIIKLFVAWAILKEIDRGRLKLAEQIKISPADKVSGHSIIADLDFKSLSVKNILYFLLAHSDNTAQNLLEKILPPQVINRVIQQSGFLKTHFVSLTNSRPDNFSVTTPQETAKLLTAIWQAKHLSLQSSQLILNFLSQTRDTYLGLRYLPCKLNVKKPEIINFYSKIGQLDQVVNNCLLLETKQDVLNICVFINHLKVKKFKYNVDHRGAKLIAKITQTIYHVLNSY